MNFQKSVYSDRDRVRFRVNVAVTADALLPLGHQGKPNEFDCVIRLDLDSFVRPAGSWFVLDAETDLLALGRAIVDDLKAFALPYLHTLSTGEAVEAELPNWPTVSSFRRSEGTAAATLQFPRHIEHTPYPAPQP